MIINKPLSSEAPMWTSGIRKLIKNVLLLKKNNKKKVSYKMVNSSSTI